MTVSALSNHSTTDAQIALNCSRVSFSASKAAFSDFTLPYITSNMGKYSEIPLNQKSTTNWLKHASA